MSRIPVMNTRLKILHVVLSLDPGGMENGIVNIANALECQGVETHVFCLNQAGAFASRIRTQNRVHVHGKGEGFSFRAARGLFGAIRSLRPDVLHTHNLGPLIYASLATAIGQVRPILHGEHSQLAEHDLTPRRLLQRKVGFRAAKLVHTVGAESQRQILDLRLTTAVEVIYNGVDAERFQPEPHQVAKARVGIPGDSRVIGIVGRFGPFKQHRLLLEAFNHIAAQDPGVHLLIVGGGGPDEASVRERASRSPAAHRIHFTGLRNDPEKLYTAMDLLVVPSTNEGLSNAILEGMACGRPVLSHQSCGASEVILDGVNGRIADLSTAEKTAEGIRSLLSDPEQLFQMGVQARSTVVERFSLSRMAERYSHFYRQVSSGSGGWEREQITEQTSR